MLKEFKEFAMKGPVIELAVGVIIGAAFGKIVSSLVDDIIMVRKIEILRIQSHRRQLKQDRVAFF